jgi:hypothetical protein
MSGPVPEGRPRPPALPLPPASSSRPGTVRRTLATTSGGGGSLLERTAHLFAPESTSEHAAPPASPAEDAVPPASTTITQSLTPHTGGPAVPDSASMDPQQLDAVIAAVVERIEQRVVDELERRGRGAGRSGF